MSITKSNKHKLSLDRDKPNEKGGYTLATPYALMRSLILYYQISVTPLGSCSPFHSKVFSQLNKWARELNWMSRRSVFSVEQIRIQNITVRVQLSTIMQWPDAGWSDRTRRSVANGDRHVSCQRRPLRWLSIHWQTFRKTSYMCDSSGKSAEIADSGEKGLHHANNWLFNPDKPINLSDLTCYL